MPRDVHGHVMCDDCADEVGADHPHCNYAEEWYGDLNLCQECYFDRRESDEVQDELEDYYGFAYGDM